MIASNQVKAYNLPSGIVFDMLREGAGHRPGVLTKVGMDTFVDPDQEGGAMNEAAAAEPIVKHVEFEGENWLYFAALRPDVAIIRATTGDERGNLAFRSEGAYLGAMEMALAAHNCGGTVIAQVRQVAQNGSLRPHDVHVPGILVDALVEAPDMLQTTATTYDSGDIRRTDPPDRQFPDNELWRAQDHRTARGAGASQGMGGEHRFWRVGQRPARYSSKRAATAMSPGVIEQGAIGGVPLLDFKFGCAANADAFVTSPHQFTYFQAGGFDASLLSFLEIDADGSVNVSRLKSVPHRTAGAGGFVDITARARRNRVFGNIQRRREDAHRERQAGDRHRGAHGQGRAQSGPCLVLWPTCHRTRPGSHLCHRALRHAGWTAEGLEVSEIRTGRRRAA